MDVLHRLGGLVPGFRSACKISIFADDRDIEDLTMALEQLKSLQLTPDEDSGDWGSGAREQWSQRAERFGSLQRRLDPLVDILGVEREPVEPPEHLTPTRDAVRIEDEVREAERAIQDWQERHDAAQREDERYRLLLQEMRLLAGLDIPVEKLRAFEQVYLVIGTLPKQDLAGLSLPLVSTPFVIIPTIDHGDRTLVFAACASAHAAILDRALASAFLDPLELPDDLTGSPAEVSHTLQEGLRDVQEHLAELQRELDELAWQRGDRLVKLWYWAQADAELSDRISQFPHKGTTYLITGWMPRGAFDQLTEIVQNLTHGASGVTCLLEERPRE